MSDTAIAIFVSLLMVRFIAMEAIYQRARRTGSGLRFPVGIGLRILLRVGGPIGIYTGYKMLGESATGFDTVVAIAVALLGSSCILVEPGEITTGPEGIKQKKCLGLQTRFVPWERAAARYVSGLREVLVIGRNGTFITHSQYHVGQEQFLHELTRHAVFLQGAQ